MKIHERLISLDNKKATYFRVTCVAILPNAPEKEKYVQICEFKLQIPFFAALDGARGRWT